MVKISFIIPAYNGGFFLENCLDSILNVVSENYFDLEVILIDDGSVDNTAELSSSYSLNFYTIIIHQKNHGVSSARNAGILCATGEYIVFVDADDELDSEKLKKLLLTIQGKTNIDIAIYGVIFQYYQNGNCFLEKESNPSERGIYEKKDCISILDKLFAENALSSSCNKIIKRDIITRNNVFFNEDMILFEDTEFSLRLLDYCNQVVFFPHGVYIYRQQLDNHYANRYKRITHISYIAEPIKKAVHQMKPDDYSIPLTIYLWVASDVLLFTPITNIKDLCNEFHEWICKNSLENSIRNDYFALEMYNVRVVKLIIRRNVKRLKSRINAVLRREKFYTVIYERQKGAR